MSELSKRSCEPCRGGIPPLSSEQIKPFITALGSGWDVVNDHHIKKTYAFPDFVSALAFTNQVGDLAEAEGHHPDIFLTWGKVEIKIWTHKIDGLSESDFILAAKCDEL